jgi:N-ethylmaleimide reductase
MAAAVGAEKVGLRSSRSGEINDIKERDAEELYRYVVPKLNDLNLAYLHIGTFDQTRDRHPILRSVYDGVYFHQSPG